MNNNENKSIDKRKIATISCYFIVIIAILVQFYLIYSTAIKSNDESTKWPKKEYMALNAEIDSNRVKLEQIISIDNYEITSDIVESKKQCKQTRSATIKFNDEYSFYKINFSYVFDDATSSVIMHDMTFSSKIYFEKNTFNSSYLSTTIMFMDYLSQYNTLCNLITYDNVNEKINGLFGSGKTLKEHYELLENNEYMISKYFIDRFENKEILFMDFNLSMCSNCTL